jgi:hypothetical protein
MPREARRLLYQSSDRRPSDHWDDPPKEDCGDLAEDFDAQTPGAAMPISEQVIDEAYQKLSKARFDAWQAAERVAMRRADLQRARANRIVTGEINGRNEVERDAQARAMLPDEFAALERAELEDRRAGIAVELCRIEIERIQTVIRYLSLSTTPGLPNSANQIAGH